MSRWAIFALPLLLLATPAYGQETAPTTVQDADAETPLTEAEKRALALKAREAAELRIEQDMVTMTSLVEALSKNLGQIHYLRTLCFGLNDQKWRDYGERMMDVEANGDKDRHRQLVRAFNAGYYQEKDRHTECSSQVSVDVAALAENGRHISSMLGDPYREN